MDWQSALGVIGTLVGIAGGYYAWRSLDDRVVNASQEMFRDIRSDLRERFGALSRLSADLHIEARPSLGRIGGSDLLVDETMEPPSPIPLSEVQVEWDDTNPPFDPSLMKASRRILPRRTRWEKFPSYSAALSSLMPPAIFENRFSFRLVAAEWRSPDGPKLVLGIGKYFDVIDQGEALAHELAAATRRAPASVPTWRRLPMRDRLKADPLSVASRAVLPSIGTLTIRRTPDGQGTYFLMYRGVGQVAIGEGIYHIIPGGMFQPASISPLGYRRDLDMWRNIMREYNEEMLGAPESTGDSGIEIDYTQPPYSDFEQALSDGSLRVWSFGMGLEPVNLAPCLLTIAVFEAQAFDDLFSSIVERNDEGVLITGPRTEGVMGMPLDEAEVSNLLNACQVAPIASALLHLALRHRTLLLET